MLKFLRFAYITLIAVTMLLCTIVLWFELTGNSSPIELFGGIIVSFVVLLTVDIAHAHVRARAASRRAKRGGE